MKIPTDIPVLLILLLMICAVPLTAQEDTGGESYDILGRNTQILSPSGLADAVTDAAGKSKQDLLKCVCFFKSVFSEHVSYAVMVMLFFALSAGGAVFGIRKMNKGITGEQQSV